jgi:TolB-like protein/DNA-binding winged helix-turn-helix (wHTH) protein/tetratricopeptide (TPR) repeat protein
MTTPADAPPSVFRFADLTLDAARRRVTRQGQPVELKALDFDLLRFLVESAPNVVNADVLAEKVWCRHFVSPENVAQRVMLLRQSLDDDANRPRYIETVRNKGYRLIPVVERVPAVETGDAPRRRGLAAVAAALVFAVGVTAALSYWLAGTDGRPAPIPNSVAVLPFVNLSPNADDPYFALSMQDLIATQLTKINEIFVIPVQPGTDEPASVAEVVRGLNVATTLGGTVSYSEGRVRVTPRLTSAQTGESLWSQVYERDLGDVFAIQTEIALDVARALRLELSAAERARIERLPSTERRARDFYRMAMTRDLSATPAETLRAIEWVDQAVALDDKFTEAWLLKSGIHTGYAQFMDPEHADEHRALGERAVRRALDLDPELGQAHSALALTLYGKRDWIGAEREFRKARDLNVPLARLGSYAFLQLGLGELDLPRDIFERAQAAEPRNGLFYRALMLVHERLGDRATAKDLYTRGISVLSGDNRDALLMHEQQMHSLVWRHELAEARTLPVQDRLHTEMLAAIDTPDHARTVLRREFAASGAANSSNLRNIGIWAGSLGDSELALRAMQAAIDTQGALLAYVWLPQFKEMRGLPEFKTYLREIGVVKYWDEYDWPPSCRRLNEHDFECD